MSSSGSVYGAVAPASWTARLEKVGDLCVARAPLADTVELAAKLSLLGLILRPAGSWTARAPLIVTASLALLYPRLVRVPALWLGLAALVALRLAVDWPLPDNHAYLGGYWCLAIALSFLAPEPQRAVRLAARQLLALTFALAVIWKALLSPDYLDERFFRVTLLTDERFANSVMLFTGLTRADIEANREAMKPPPPGTEPFEWQPPYEPPAFRTFATVITWATLASEALLAVLFALPFGERAGWARNGALIGFCGATYALAPVPGFGWLLLAMGLAQLHAGAFAWRTAYLVMFFLVFLYSEIPWARLALTTQAFYLPMQ